MSEVKTILEIIDEMVAYYSEDVSRRAKEGDRCCYKTEDGRECALGRYLKHPEMFSNSLSANKLLNENGVSSLKEEYQIDDPWFWRTLQFFHDTDANWNDGGLTEDGLIALEKLKQKYA